ncbi:hypothetical protein [Amycolatopsis aidingensis]|uniref:hypothetical protein n=1 Tax=Amycolatopsis aidingensis TaxID=2842453 RepID=UPI001C0ACB45|nr:hypothetical protein [Amycolatopsis aidingensis]
MSEPGSQEQERLRERWRIVLGALLEGLASLGASQAGCVLPAHTFSATPPGRDSETEAE